MEDRIKQLETITGRLMRRGHKTTSVIIPPYPVSNTVFGEAIKGTILCYMFPCSGIITSGMIRFGSKPKKEVSINIAISNEIGSQSQGFMINKRSLNLKPDMKVQAGDCMEISLNPIDEVVNEVWISFLWIPEMCSCNVKNFAIKELENDNQVEDEEMKTIG